MLSPTTTADDISLLYATTPFFPLYAHRSKSNILPFVPKKQTKKQEPVVGADVNLLKTDVDTILGDLSAREAFVLRMRFGIGGNSPSTLAVVGRRLHVTRERVRQIQLAAIKKLRGRSPTHEVLYSDRAVAREKDPAAVQACGWDDGDCDGHDDDDDRHYGGLPPAVLIGLVKQALEPHPAAAGEEEEGEEMRDAQGNVVTGARRRLMGEAIQAERARAAAAAAAAGSHADEKEAASPVKGKKKKRDFVMKRARSPDGCGGGGGGGMEVGIVASGHPTEPPPVTPNLAWQPSLQAA